MISTAVPISTRCVMAARWVRPTIDSATGRPMEMWPGVHSESAPSASSTDMVSRLPSDRKPIFTMLASPCSLLFGRYLQAVPGRQPVAIAYVEVVGRVEAVEHHLNGPNHV